MGISEIVKDISAVSDGLPSDVTEEERKQLLAACQKLMGAWETPDEKAFRVIFGPFEAMALRLGVDMKLFDAAVSLSGAEGEMRTEQLATWTTADPSLIKYLLAWEPSMELDRTHYVTSSPLADLIIHITTQNEILAKLPNYFERYGFKNPGDAYNGPFQYAMETELHYFGWLESKPSLQRAFNTVVSISDVGGGKGHDLIAFKKMYPELPGNLIVQDLPIVIDEVQDLPSGIQAMKYDFFKPQPIKGAKAYYLRTVFHDWPDKQTREILENIRAAMDKDSILLINENALPEANVPLYPAILDLHMMATFSSLDRTPTQFKELLTALGFEVVGIYTPKSFVPGSGTLFEAVVKP